MSSKRKAFYSCDTHVRWTAWVPSVDVVLTTPLFIALHLNVAKAFSASLPTARFINQGKTDKRLTFTRGVHQRHHRKFNLDSARASA